MGTARIAPTITHRVRAFLRAQGVDMRPWSGLDETYAGLYELLRERRDDPGFWGPLSELLESVLAGASDAARKNLPAPSAELLESWDVDRLVRDLRAALDRPGASSVVGFASRLPQAAMGAFLVLGLVAAGACASRSQTDAGDSTSGTQDGTDGGDAGDDGATGSSGTGSSGSEDTTSTGGVGTGGTGTATGGSGTATGGSGTDTGSPTVDTTTSHTDSGSSTGSLTTTATSGSTQTDTTTTTLPGWAQDCDLDPDSVLFQTIDESDLPDYSKEDLCTCFAGLNADWNTGLTELFENETPEVIAAVLEEMLECCWWDPNTFNGDFAQSRDDLLSGNLCFVAPPYRGVTFPHEP